ncbi:MAG: hypothetical protein EZS28_001822 [Streblomastix strix]|uniref:Uncharacterized protein n=1 Tax=Streblomastix strix TaxID=222440 RepID=A0A5J4X5Z5_9EUKA|nr:MAG: hypothetical protein EZS28_001822 [Streblomastix strix]
MYMPRDVTSVIKDEYRARQIIYNESRFSCHEDIIENKVNASQFPMLDQIHEKKKLLDDYRSEVTRKSVIQKQGLMPEVISNRVGVSGIITKTIVLKNQSCAPLLYGINADKYIIDESH